MKDLVVAYIYNEKGQHGGGIYLEKDPKQIASFLVRTKDAFKVVMTDVLDLPFLNTIPHSGGFLDLCNREFLPSLLQQLIPMQTGEMPTDKVNFVEENPMFKSTEEHIKWLNETFKLNLSSLK